MTVQEAKAYFISELANVYTKQECLSLFYMVCNYSFKMDKVTLALESGKLLDSHQFENFEMVLCQLKKQKPIQYIYGFTFFYGLKFELNTNVLIPRPETEELVDIIVRKYKDMAIDLLDIGAGSGCISISLAKKIPKSKVFGVDVSKKALTLARHNATLNNVDVQFSECNILESQKLSKTYDVIVSNPPYVRHLEKKMMSGNVLDYEPYLALFVDDDNPLVFYDKIAQLSKQHLNKKGVLYLEINQYLGQETKELVKRFGFTTVELLKDFKGHDRFIVAQL